MKLVEKRDYNFLFYWLAVFIFVGFLVFTVTGRDGLIRLIQLKHLKQELAAKNEALLRTNIALRQEQKNLKDLRVIEYLARKSLGLVYPDETVFVFDKGIGP
ncbi:MAG: septum formation initiator family protein [Deltaproteobacteria bacterium]|nr:septum formation initiator family protein [Deltaproteobacteria bacterium]